MTGTSPAAQLVLAFACACLLAACATPGDKPETAPSAASAPAAPPPEPSPPPPPPAPPPPPPPTAASELAAGIKAYDDGDYKTADQKLTASLDMSPATPAERAQAHKYKAFMVCVTGREKPCREEFRLALVADPTFALAPAEATHPVWPKVLASVKQEMARAAARKAPPAKAAATKVPAKAAPSTGTPPAAKAAPASATPPATQATPATSTAPATKAAPAAKADPALVDAAKAPAAPK